MKGKWKRGALPALLVACGVMAATFSQVPAADAASGFRCSGKRATVVGTENADVLRGTPHGDVFAGLGGNDRIFGGGGPDVVCGGGGNDKLFGRQGNDILDGGREPTRAFRARAAARSAPAKVPRTP